MANVLTSFLVGIGWETSDFDKGTKEIERSMQGVKVSTLAISAAILGVFGGVATAAINTAQKVDQLSLATQNLNTNKQFVYNLGGAMRLMGGDAANALTEVQAIEETLANFRLKGELGAIGQLPFASVQLDDLARSESASEFLSKLADQIPNLNNPQKQIVQQSLGLSDATMKAISGGGQEFEGLLQRSEDLTGTITQLTDDARKLSENFATFGLQLEGITNEITAKTLPGLVGLSSWANKFVADHREEISGAIDTVAEQPGATAALGGGAAATVFGSLIAKLGLKTIGGLASKAGVIGQIGGGATLATDITFDTLEEKFPGFKPFQEGIDQKARDIGLGPAVDFSNWLFNTDTPQQSPDTREMTPTEKLLGLPPDVSPRDVNGGSIDSGDMTQPGGYTPIPLPEMTRPTESMLPDRTGLTPEAVSTPYKDVTPRTTEDNDTLVRAIQAAKLNVNNDVNLNVYLDGQAIDAKITEVTERANYSTIDDVRSSTAR